jgi:hypothetical protein
LLPIRGFQIQGFVEEEEEEEEEVGEKAAISSAILF